ncbi:MAG: hypothetical protein CVU07_10365 [Bacteroidetes bacterium HGW-Bacteroidetes-23]|nr:MAG: hypothetical protein CVU07_10365 [Bacteroidetes bacterium HGW-Bacteroidetes-23]
MNINELKLEIIRLILKVEDETVLLAIQKIIENKFETSEPPLSLVEEPTEKILSETENKIIGYDADGKALNLLDYNKKVEEGLNDIKNNRVISQEKLEKEIEGWYNE